MKFPDQEPARYQRSLDLWLDGKAAAALALLEPMLDKGDAHAHALAGAIYEFGGDGIEVDFSKAKYCYQLAAESVGALAACFGLARMHFFGKGVERDLASAQEIYSAILEEVDDPAAHIGLARIYLDDQWEPNLPLAEQHLKGPVVSGHVEAYSLMVKLRRKQGRVFSAIYFQICSRLKAAFYVMKDRNDPRLGSA
ncbi:MAG: sel1 repeat family protein [Xanthomonadales bacterium]|nr:sel1 repeat family protein [Xanthomonadales bacterium]